MMEYQATIALLGGDLRQHAAAVGLARKGWQVRLWGIKINQTEDGITCLKDCKDALKESRAVILPLPVSKDGQTLNCPLIEQESPLSLQEIARFLEPQSLILGGKFPEWFRDLLKEKSITCLDYCDNEIFQTENAYLTAEAALEITLNRLDIALRDATVAVVGFGRIAKHLAALLKKIGANVTVVARRDADIALAKSFGCSVISIKKEPSKNLLALSKQVDVIYNTVPAWLFDRDFLERVDPRTLLIDLASAPGGFDVCAAKELKSNVLWATSLPGKYAPQSAGNLICECVHEILLEEIV